MRMQELSFGRPGGGGAAGWPNNNALIVNAYHLSMGGRGSRRALFYRYFRLGGSLALPVRLLRCPIADLNLGIAGNHYRPINELLFGCPAMKMIQIGSHF